ncbi:transposable element Tc1 transposase [Trichonephila clavipes]|nr:transposable element Tc1 transposase [Trichonephila clavipes]
MPRAASRSCFHYCTPNRHSTKSNGLECHFFDNRNTLVVSRGTLTAHRYVDAILRTVLLPFLLQNPGLIFQQDNARLHTVRVAMNCRTYCQILPWRAKSPDLSPIQPV